MPRSLRLIGPVLAALLLCVPLPIVQAEAPDLDAVFASPSKIHRLRSDPWLDGVWIASEGGLFFKDMAGGDLGHYSLAQGLPNGIVYDVDADPYKVWVGTGGGAAVLDKATQSIQAVRNPDGSLLQSRVRTVFIEGDHGWLGTEGQGLYRVDGSSLVATPVNNPVNNSAFAHPIYGLGSVGSELYVSVTGYGLVDWKRDTGQAKKIDYGYTYNNGAPRYGRILVTPQWVWVGTEMDGVIRIDRAEGKLYEYASKDDTNSPTVHIPLQVGDEVWMSTLSGVSRYTASTQRWANWQYVPYDAGGEPISDLAFHDGTLYAATAQGRIARFDRGVGAWFPEDWWESGQVMSGNLINGCGTDGGDRLLFSTGNLASYYDSRSNTWAIAGQEPTDRVVPRDISILSTAADSKQRYFTHYSGVSELEVATGEYVTYQVDGRGIERWGNRAVLDVEIDDTDAWFGMRSLQESGRFQKDPPWHPGMVTRMDRQTHQMTYYGKEQGLTDSNVTALESDGGLLWIGMGKGGLDVLHKQTGAIVHVYPSSGLAYVNDIVVLPDAIWLAATTRGVVRIDRATMEATAVPLPAFAMALAYADGQLWVGTRYGGIYALDPDTHQTTRYSNGYTFDYNAYCLIAREGMLYIGGDVGVQLFSLAERRFLPQTTVASGRPVEPESFHLAITSPAEGSSASGAMLDVAGTAAGPEGAIVRVRAGDGQWQKASGLQSWSIPLDLNGTPAGGLVVTARLESGGQVLAQGARTVQLRAAESAIPVSVALHHVPVLEARVGDSIRFAATATPLEVQGLRMHAELQRPGSSSLEEIPLAAGLDGNLSGEAPPFLQTGVASYRLVASWDGGAAQFPEPLSGFGPTYQITVLKAGGFVRALASGPDRIDLRPGESQEVNLTIQNVGTRTARFNVSLYGDAAEWAQAPPSIEVPAGESRQVRIKVDVPSDAKSERYTLGFALRPAMPEEAISQFQMAVNVGTGTGDGKAGQGAPAPAWLALAALSAAAWVARRRPR